MRYSKFIVALVILLNTVFAGAVLFIYLRVGSEPTALIAAWFAFTGSELWLLAGIKKKECTKNDENKSKAETLKSKVLGHGHDPSHDYPDSP